jgi:hypothetical protein
MDKAKHPVTPAVRALREKGIAFEPFISTAASEASLCLFTRMICDAR